MSFHNSQKISLFVTLSLAPALFSNADNSRFISNVFDFSPAPGQFVNEIPEWEEGDSYQEILQKAAENIVGSANAGMISLGSFGGYVVFGFDHPVANRHGFYDFKVYGNAVISNSELDGGNCEPGIIWVSTDTNGNGRPDDEWYELKGSEWSHPSTIRNYSVTYRHPSTNASPKTHPDFKFVTDAEYIEWSDSEGDSGFMWKNSAHDQCYWPLWDNNKEEITLTGTLLAPNALLLNDKGTNVVLRAYEWGYADNRPNSDCPGFNIDHAVDAAGHSVLLEKVDFIKVQTATLQNCWWFGEASTEVTGAEDLHPDYVYSSEWPDNPEDPFAIYPGNSVTLNPFSSSHTHISAIHDDNILILADRDTHACIFDITGNVIMRLDLCIGANTVSISSLPSGVFIIPGIGKFIK